MTIYQNNQVEITIDRRDVAEAIVHVNGDNLIWISWEQREEFKKELAAVLDKYRI
jgi:hypothetical protein